MKWNENGTEFEGTPAEYAELKRLMQAEEEPHVQQPVQVESMTRAIIAPPHRRAVRLTGPAGYEDFVNIKEAWKHIIANTTGRIGYSTLCKLMRAKESAIGIGGITAQFADVPMATDDLPIGFCGGVK